MNNTSATLGRQMMPLIGRFGWILTICGGLLVVLGIVAWPPGGLLFALPYLFLIPGVPMFITGGVILLICRRLTTRSDSD